MFIQQTFTENAYHILNVGPWAVRGVSHPNGYQSMGWYCDYCPPLNLSIKKSHCYSS